MDQKWMTRVAAAAYLGTTKGTLATWACANKGPRFYKPSGKCLYSVDDLDAWAAAHPIEPIVSEEDLSKKGTI